MGFADIAANLGGAIVNTISAFKGDIFESYNIQISPRVSNVIKDNDKSWRKSLGYAFQAVRVKNGVTIEDKDWQEFRLQINPQELSQDEIFAIQVTPTYTGVLVEHQGITLKDITISGTTGLSPNRRAGGAFPQSGAPVFAAGHSGYREFHHLRTYIRTYVEQKRDDPGKDQGELRLIWKNFRDKEILFVEPQRFSMKRSAKRPHLYDYSIQLKAIGIASDLAKAAGFTLGDLDDFIENIQDALDSASKIIDGATGFILTVDSDFKATIMGPVKAYIAALKALQNGKNQTKNLFLSKFKTIAAIEKEINKNLDIGKKKDSSEKTKKDLAKAKKDAMKKAKEDTAINEMIIKINKSNILKTMKDITKTYNNITDAIGIDSGSYAETKNFISTTLKSPTPKIGYDEVKALNAFKDLKQALAGIIVLDIFKDDPDAGIDDIVAAVYENQKQAADTSAAMKLKSDLQSDLIKAKVSGDPVAQKVAQNKLDELEKANAAKAGKGSVDFVPITKAMAAFAVTIGGNDNIQTLAAQYLGSPDKYKDLVFYNGLEAPYVDTTGTSTNPKVLKPGDKILIPIKSSPKSTNNVSKSNPAPINKDLSETQKNFGVDFKLTSDFDIAVNAYGEPNLIAASGNVAQRIILRLLLGTGSLQRHPEVGVGLSIGEKSSSNLGALLDRVRTSLSNDSSVENVIFAEVDQSGSSLLINLILKLKDVDQPLTTTLKVA